MRPPKVDEMRSVEASLRVDAVASAGFRMPRSKCVAAITSGDVRINWKSTGVKPGKTVQTGDVISIRGKGRLEIGDISKTNKGRYAVEMVRFI
ncbi:hypothetical protein CYMTET_21983 [Cymbomonas tetramitiformis]|uniref:RNA-binding S4 domain-containing protein n=1 Tax=Cymbomonas tetramitiformis TaxID=36881 RepID=A0AAE0L2L4_9CHLO|nr:hypothetical protein CYMTET_21983 [Cymbomonas tetramitiformis]